MPILYALHAIAGGGGGREVSAEVEGRKSSLRQQA